jgi:signal transduction histidine kinase
MTTIFSQGKRLINYKSASFAALCVLWAAILAGVVFLVYLGVSSYHRAQDRLSDQAVSYAHLIASHDRYGFTMADALLKGMLDHLTWDDFNGDMSASRRAEVLARLLQYKERLPGIASFTVVGADGVRRIGAVGKNFTDLSHRGYFQALRDGGLDFYISNAEEGLASSKPGVHVARRFVGPDGKFGGVIVLNLAVQDVFFPFYKSLSLGKNFATSLRDRKRILITFPENKAVKWTVDDSGPVSQLLASGTNRGVLVENDPVDGIEKVTAVEQLEGSNIFATASLPIADAMSGPRMTAIGALIAAIACLFGGFAATIAIIRTRALEEARDDAMKANTEKRKLIQKLNSISEDERKSIAIEIHDELNANLIAARLDAQRIVDCLTHGEQTSTTEEIANRAQSIVALTRKLYAIGRGIMTRLRPEVLDTLGLDGAVSEMVQNLDAGLPTCRFRYNASGDFKALDSGRAIAAYRVTQEALSNIVKHAKASNATVTLRLGPNNGLLDIDIVDDGVGFDLETVTPGIGIIGMRERVYEFQGKIDFRTSPGKGTEVAASLPPC